MNIAELITAYMTDPLSSYHKLRYATRVNYDGVLRRLQRDCGAMDVTEIRARKALELHKQWVGDAGRLTMAHSLVSMLRTISTFGATILEDRDCRSLKELLGDMRFEMPKARTERLTAAQITAIREQAWRAGFPSIALAQAFQFECTLRQKDCLGELIPINEPGPCEYMVGTEWKWARGLKWSEIDGQMILRHVTSKRQKPVTVDLKLAPMVLVELRQYLNSSYGSFLRGSAVQPLVICEVTGEPYRTHQFRRMWRRLADVAGVPKHVRNMDSRAGAITEAIECGATIEEAGKAATHSQTSMTAKYYRGDAEAIASTMAKRAANRAA